MRFQVKKSDFMMWMARRSKTRAISFLLQTAFLGTLCFGPLLGIGLAVLLLGFMARSPLYSHMYTEYIHTDSNIYLSLYIIVYSCVRYVHGVDTILVLSLQPIHVLYTCKRLESMRAEALLGSCDLRVRPSADREPLTHVERVFEPGC